MSPVELEKYYFEKYYIEPVTLRSEEQSISDPSKVVVNKHLNFERNTVRVPGTMIEVSIPFEGNADLWHVRPNEWGASYPDVRIDGNFIALTYSFSDDIDGADAGRLEDRISRDIRNLKSAITNLKSHADTYNQEIKPLISGAIGNKFKNARSALRVVANLGIPIKRVSAPDTYVAPIQRRKTPVSLPKQSNESFKPEPVLNVEEYNFILKTLSSMALVMERSPRVFLKIDEETIRTHFLISLNSHYEGGASGETFNGEGKTDILIRVDNKNVFVAECKFWKGEKSFDDAISQLLGYLTWRDSKCALLIFNKNKDSSSVKTKMDEVMIGRSECKKASTSTIESIPKYVFVKDSDPGREIIMSTLLFDIPS